MSILKKIFGITEVYIDSDSDIKEQNYIPPTESNNTYNETFAKTVFLFTQNGSELKSNNEYQRYLSFDYGITNPRNMHKLLIDEGYFTKPILSDVLHSYKLPTLKEILDKINEKKSGNKEELIQRIIENIDIDLENEILNSSKIFVLSDKGKNFLEENKDLVMLYKHRGWNIDIKTYLEAKDKISFKANFNDVVWNIFNEQSLEHLINKSFQSLEHDYYFMSELLLEEKKYKRSLHFLLMSLYNSLSCVDNLDYIKYIKSNIWTKEEVLEMRLHPHSETLLISKIANLQEYYEDGMLANVFKQTNLPFNCCKPTLFEQLINDIFSKPHLDFDYYIDEIDNEFKKFIKSL